MLTGADTCHQVVAARLVDGGWSTVPPAIGKQRDRINSRITVGSGKMRRGKRECGPTAALPPAALEPMFAGGA